MSPVDHTRSPSPLRGNQLANALLKASVVQPAEPSSAPPPRPVRANPFVAAPYDKTAVLADVRTWLARIVAGQRVPNSQLTNQLAHHRVQQIVDRFKARGLITTRTGASGGATATEKLVELARTDITDEKLSVLVFEDPDDSEMVAPRKAVVVEAAKPGPMPDNPIARERYCIDSVRAWLARGADGAELQVIDMMASKNSYNISPRLREAGLIERQGAVGAVHYTVPEAARDQVRSLSDEQLARFIWPNRSALLTQEFADAPAQTEPSNEVLPEPNEEEMVSAPGATVDTLELLAMRYGQIVEVLVRLDARFSRLERELGLKPIEEEVPK